MSDVIPSAYLSMRRGLIAFALVWQAAWLFSDPELWPGGSKSGLESLLLAGAWLSVAILVFVMIVTRSPKRIHPNTELLVGLNLVFIVAAALVLSIHAGSTNENEWFLAASLFNLSAGTAGIMIRNPKQWFFVVAIVGLEAYLFLSLGFFDSGDLGVNSAILYPFYALALAVGAGSAQRMLLNRAHEIDELQNMVVLEVVSLKTAHEVDSYIESLRRAVHEVVLNTLTAISRGSLNDSPESRRLIRDRSAEAIVILSDLSQPSVNVSTAHAGTTIDTLADLLVECAHRGIHVRITGDVNSKPPEHVTEGLVAAAREAVINSLRHSELTELVIRVSEGRDYCIEIEDNGLGFDPNQTPHGFGLTSLLNSTDALAIAIISHSTRGTVVQICAARKKERVSNFTFESKASTISIVLPVLTTWFAFSTLSILMSWSQFQNPLVNLVSLSVLGVASMIAIVQSRTGSVRASGIAVSALGAIAVYVVAELSNPIVNTPWTGWASAAIAALFLAMAAAGPWWGWIAVGISWLVIQQNFPAELIAPGFLIIMAGAFFGMQLRRTDRARVLALGEQATNDVKISLSDRMVASKMERYVGVVPHPIIELLAEISEGNRDPWSSEVQRECGVAESHLRRAIFGNLDLSDPVASFADHLSRSALEHGLLFDISLDHEFINDSQLHDTGLFLEGVMNLLPLDSTSRLSTANEGNQGFIRFVASYTADNEESTRQLHIHLLTNAPTLGTSEVLLDSDGTAQFLWEAILEGQATLG